MVPNPKRRSPRSKPNLVEGERTGDQLSRRAKELLGDVEFLYKFALQDALPKTGFPRPAELFLRHLDACYLATVTILTSRIWTSSSVAFRRLESLTNDPDSDTYLSAETVRYP